MFNCLWYDFKNNTAPVLNMLYHTTLVKPYSKILVAIILKVWAILITEILEVIKRKSSTNDRDITVGLFFITVSKTSLI